MSMSAKARRWIDAGIILGNDPHAKVKCPECLNADLTVWDQPLGEDRIERHMKCLSCGEYNSLLKEKSTDLS